MLHYRLGLVGFGGVNRALAGIIADAGEDYWRELGFSLSIVSVDDLMLGSIAAAEGIDPAKLLECRSQTGGFLALPGGMTHTDTSISVVNSPADIIIEATPTNAQNGEPAISHCRAALSAGKHLATVNKGVVVHGAETLAAAARDHGVQFEYEGSVMSGTPVIRLCTDLLRGAGFRGFEGILNGTSNFVLDRMAAGIDFAEAVSEAQERGYAEADPTADIAGHDVRLKVVILANRLLGADIRPGDVACRGIEHLTGEDIREAAGQGLRWKLVGRASRDAEGILHAEVAPVALPVTHALATVNGATNALLLDTAMLGAVTVTGPGAGGVETAYALISDIVAIHRKANGALA